MTTLTSNRKPTKKISVATVQPLTKRKAWKALATHFKEVQDLHLRNLFDEDPERGERMTLEAAGLGLFEKPRY